MNTLTKHTIINDLAAKQFVENVAKHYCTWIRENDIYDFSAEIYLSLLEMPDEKIVELYNNNQLEFYVIAIVRNQATNYKSAFNKKYRGNEEIYLEELHYESTKECEE